MRSVALLSALLLAMSAQAAGLAAKSISVPDGDGGSATKRVASELPASSGAPKFCGVRLYYAGMAEDGQRMLNCDGTGDYVDGTSHGTLHWYYLLTDDDAPRIQSFESWGMGPAATGDSAVAILITYKGEGDLDGKTYASVIGVVQGQVQMSPTWAAKR